MRPAGSQGKDDSKSLPKIFDEFVKGDPVSMNNALEDLDEYVKSVLRGVPSSKMRNIYALIRHASLAQDGESKLKELVYFKYKIAYMAARDSNLKRFERDVTQIISKVVQGKGTFLDEFFTFSEAIVAFHKKHAK